MDKVKDYTCKESCNSHYNGVPSMYGKNVAEQNRMIPDYCNPGKADGHMKAQKSNKQAGA